MITLKEEAEHYLFIALHMQPSCRAEGIAQRMIELSHRFRISNGELSHHLYTNGIALLEMMLESTYGVACSSMIILDTHHQNQRG